MAKKKLNVDKRDKGIVATCEFFAFEQGRESVNTSDIRLTSEKLGVSEQIVKKALRSNGIEWKDEKTSVASLTKSNILPVIAAILRGQTLEEAGQAGGVTKQWASAIRQSMIDSGIFEAAEYYVIRTALMKQKEKKDGE